MKRTRTLLRLVTSTALLVAGSCTSELPPRSQLVLHVDTDAIVPPAVGVALGPDDPPPLFDTLLVEVFEPGATEPCDGCARQFALDADHFRNGAVSLGIPAAAGVSGYRARIRMYPARATLSGEPPAPSAEGVAPTSVVDTVVALPPADGVVHASVFLATDSVGAPAGTLDAPVAPAPGPPGASRVGTWPGARRIACAGAARDGEVCVRGGAFWMGNAKVTGEGEQDAADHLRLVVLAPFFLDATEVTVGRARAAGLAADYAWSNGTTGTSFRDYCTYSATATGREDLPINCTTWKTATQFCRAQGGDLQSEAQFEYVASAQRGRLFAWGEDEPTCDDAVLGRAGWGLLAPIDSPCKTPSAPGGPLAVGAKVTPPRRDRVELGGGGTVYDLVGNMCEFTRDTWNRQAEPCWSHPGVYVDPVCTTVSPADGGAKHVYRGGCWDLTARLATSASRESLDDSTTVGLIGLGFRCARAATP